MRQRLTTESRVVAGMVSRRARLACLAFAAVFTLSVLPSPAAANPGVPYCAGSLSVTGTTAVTQPEVCKAVTGRVFPEASSLSTPAGQSPVQDYVSFPEAQAGLHYLEAQYPDYIQITEVAQSFGLPNGMGGVDHFPIDIVEVTNEKSPVPAADKLQLLFMLSIHGVEKGGREGGLRVIEDMVSDMGIAKEKVQAGKGLSPAIAKPGGGNVETYRDYLDFTTLVFLFPNADGWAHDEAPYSATSGPSCGRPPNGVMFCRTNGNGTDLNRQMPTIGWQFINEAQGRLPLNEPEAKGYIPYLRDHYRFNYAIDIHGMLNHHNFGAIMMPAGAMTPQEMLRSTRLAEDLKQRANSDPHFAQWTTVLGTANDETAPVDQALGDSGVADVVNQNGPCAVAGAGCVGSGGGFLNEVGSGTFVDWGTVWDAIGYTDSGISGDYFMQNTGLNAPGYDIEMAYNHITTDSQYEGAGQLFNDFHVELVRHIVKAFMDAAALDVKVSIETHGSKVLLLAPTYVATNLDDEDRNPGGWAGRNPFDDAWQYSDKAPFAVRPAKYWSDLQPFLRDGDKPGVLATTDASGLTASRLKDFDHLVIPGSAIKEIEANPAQLQAVKAFVEGGGTLVLTDEGLRFLDLAGITTGAVDKGLQYAGAIDMDRSSPLTAGVRGFARQTYEPVPLGYSLQSNSAPTWFVDASKFQGVGGTAAGFGVQGQSGGAILNEVTLGEVKLGSGYIRFIGALLPDPSEEFYHPYGLDDYAPTYSGNQILRNMLGWEEVFSAPPVVIQDSGIIQSDNEPVGPDASAAAQSSSQGSPGLGLAVLVGALAAVAVARRRHA